MAHIMVPWVKDSLYIVASRQPGSTAAADPTNPHLAFFICMREDGTRGRWITVDPGVESKYYSCRFPSEVLHTFPWTDETGREPHAILRIGSVRELVGRDPWSVPSATRDERVFTEALYRAWLVGRTSTRLGSSNTEWFLNAIRLLDEVKFLTCPNPEALLAELREATVRTSEGIAGRPAILGASDLCKQGPKPVDVPSQWLETLPPESRSDVL